MKNKEKFYKTMLILVSIILIIVVILGIYLFNNQDKDKDKDKNANTNKDIDVETVTTLGRIELIVVDENNQPVSGSVFHLIDAYNNFLMEVQSRSDGIIDFYSVPVGDYTIKQISAPEGYKIKENSKKVTVIGGELTTVKFEN